MKLKTDIMLDIGTQDGIFVNHLSSQLRIQDFAVKIFVENCI